MSKKRTSDELCAEILRVATNGAKKSHLVYQTNLNFSIIEKYLNVLVNSKLITGPSSSRGIFKITDKGLKCLELLKGFQRNIESFDQAPLVVSSIA